MNCSLSLPPSLCLSIYGYDMYLLISRDQVFARHPPSSTYPLRLRMGLPPEGRIARKQNVQSCVHPTCQNRFKRGYVPKYLIKVPASLPCSMLGHFKQHVRHFRQQVRQVRQQVRHLQTTSQMFQTTPSQTFQTTSQTFQTTSQTCQSEDVIQVRIERQIFQTFQWY